MIARFGVQLTPVAARLDVLRELARVADAEGLDLLGVQDHPYAPDHLDAFTLMGTILAETERVRVFPDVASLPLRGAAMLAKTAASLDLTGGGRFDLGLGAGAYWPAIAAMGGPTRSGAEALKALEEAIAIIRAMWAGAGDRLHLTGRHYSVDGLRPGPRPAHDIGVWIGSIGPHALALTGRVADGWAAPIPHYLPYEKWAEAQRIISGAATDAGRDPGEVIRMAQLVGDITTTPGTVRLRGEEPVRTDAAGWAAVLADLAGRGFDTFVYWPETTDHTQLLRWAREVVPATQELLG